MGSYVDVININVGFEIENCIFLGMYTIIVGLKQTNKQCFSTCDALSHQ